MLRRGAALLAIVLTILWPAGRVVQADLTPEGYAHRIDAALALVRSTERERGPIRRRDLDAAGRLLAADTVVRVGGSSVRIDLSAVRADLASGRLGAAEQRLVALRAALRASSSRAAPADAQREKSLDDILAAPPFVQPFSIGQFIGDLLRRLFDALFGHLAGASDTPIVAVIAGLICAAVLIFIASRLLGNFAPRARAAGAEEGAELPLQGLDAQTARGRAAACAAEGNYREAARYQYVSTLLALDEAGRLRIDRSTANRDVLRQARSVPRLAEALGPVVRGFDLIWFGHLTLTADEYERYRRLNERALEIDG